MGGYAIKGYINNNNKLSFTASAYLDEKINLKEITQVLKNLIK